MTFGLAFCRVLSGACIAYEGLLWIFNEQRLELITEYPSSAAISSCNHFSLFHASISPYLYTLLFSLEILCGIGLIFGYKTKQTSIILFIILTSLYRRFPVCMDRGDQLLLVLLFWGYFSKWDQILSIDKVLELKNECKHGKTKNPSSLSTLFAYYCMLIQISIAQFHFAISMFYSNSIYDGTGFIYLQ